MLDLDKVLALIEAMNDEEVEYVTFGALAMAVHGLPRGTEDADFFVHATPGNVARLRAAIRRVWDDPAVDEITHEDLAGDYPAIRYGPPDEDFTIDFLSRLGEAFSYESLEWQITELEGRSIRVVTPLMLYTMKKDTVRYKDRVDADWLRRKFSFGET
jgi:hypothetical protein